MPIKIIQSKQNPWLKQLRRALQSPGRGLVALEGPHLLDEALRAGLRPVCVFVAQENQALLQPFDLPETTEILLLPKALLDAALSTESPQPVAALLTPPSWVWSEVLSTPRDADLLLLVLAGVQDPGNFGTMARSAEAFGTTGLVCLPGTVNPWNPKALRASAGSLFRLPLIHATEDECFEHLRFAGVRLFAATVRDAQPAGQLDLTGPVALIVGNEGNGIPAPLVARCDAALTIPCPGPVESLNAAIAASILLYETSRQRGLRVPRNALRAIATKSNAASKVVRRKKM